MGADRQSDRVESLAALVAHVAHDCLRIADRMPCPACLRMPGGWFNCHGQPGCVAEEKRDVE